MRDALRSAVEDALRKGWSTRSKPMEWMDIAGDRRDDEILRTRVHRALEQVHRPTQAMGRSQARVVFNPGSPTMRG
jgi:hypothetical protein